MRVTIGGASYIFSRDVLADAGERGAYFELAKAVFGLDFQAWHDAGYMKGGFVPYVLFVGAAAVSSVGVCVNYVSEDGVCVNGVNVNGMCVNCEGARPYGAHKRYAQISTVMTLPEYRNKGLSGWLMEYVLAEWAAKADAVYLLANDSVAGFYPKFGFEEFYEYDFFAPVKRAPGVRGGVRKLNAADPRDMGLLAEKYRVYNPFSKIKVINFDQFMFHCLTFRSGDLYYIVQYDAAAIAGYEGRNLICYDVYTDSGCTLGDILGALARDDTECAYLGFTPVDAAGWHAEISREEDTHLFVLSGKENIFKDCKVKFPLLSRA